MESPSYFVPLPDSKEYVKKLDTRLSKLKGCNKELSSKDMVKTLQHAREDHMSHLICESSNNLRFEDWDADREIATSYLQRKLYPEKNGVTYEEIQRLLESDILAKSHIEETTNEIDIPR